MRLIVLGSGAGGGIPQWNANNAGSSRAFRGERASPRRTQASIAVSANGTDWLLVNASPDLRQQIIATRALHPQGSARRHSPIKAVVLTGADIDQIAGLLTMRERQAFALHATARVHETLRANAVFNVLADDVVARHAIAVGTPFSPLPGLAVTARTVPGKVALYLEKTDEPGLGSAPEDTIALTIEEPATGRRVLFAPSCARIDDAVRGLADGADVMLFDGTLFTDDEMIASGEGAKTSRRMGHAPVTGDGGSLDAFQGVANRRKLYIHINNTNPMAATDSAEHARVRAAGWEIAEDGMEIVL